MNVSRKDASDALEVIGSADRRVREIRGNREASPFLIVWGLVWLIANAVSDLWPTAAGMGWLIGVIAGCVATAVLVVLQARRMVSQQIHTSAERIQHRTRMLMLGVTVLLFFPVMLTVLWPLTGRQQNAFISLFWAFAYMASGAWLGKRLFITGLATAAAILGGYLLLREHFSLWMAVFGGGSLILGGLWLRKL